MPGDPKERCLCGHEREWHNGCSRCSCAWFLSAGTTGTLATAWRRDRIEREYRESRHVVDGAAVYDPKAQAAATKVGLIA